MCGIILTTTYRPMDEFIRNTSRTHKAGPSGNPRDLYSGGAQFEFRLGHEVPWQVFCSCPQAIQRKTLTVPQIRWQFKSSRMLCCVKWQKVTKIFKMKALWFHETLTMTTIIRQNILYATQYTHFY